MEAAPWWGGFWERLVALVKACLKKAVGHKQLTYVELVTFLQDVECMLNNRPSCEPCDEEREVLTIEARHHLLDVQSICLLQWNNEYLLWLRDYYKKGQSKANEITDIDDVVIIADEKAPRHLWEELSI